MPFIVSSSMPFSAKLSANQLIQHCAAAEIFEGMSKSIFSSRQVTSIRSCVEGCSHNNTVLLPRTRHNEAGTPESNFAEQNMTGVVGFFSEAKHRLHPHRKQKRGLVIQKLLTQKYCKSCVERTV